jgi:hypothetical protein
VATITYSDRYELEQARIYAGMNISEFDALPGTPQWAVGDERTKTHILVLYRMSNAIPAAIGDAQSRDMERKNKPRGR